MMREPTTVAASVRTIAVEPLVCATCGYSTQYDVSIVPPRMGNPSVYRIVLVCVRCAAAHEVGCSGEPLRSPQFRAFDSGPRK